MNAAIEVDNLSKQFRINHSEARRNGEYRTLRESLNRLVSTSWQNLRGGAALGRVEEFWALRGISFSVEQGDVVGIIGRNGAGKSTLLKILTRITEPTSGRAIIQGRVGSLLEVGTGFHPELTGRENVFLNGSILGMSRREIKRNFDHILDFSGVERFVDTPVKRYSSGMKVRLAFSIAAHLDLEVMLIDEVLAVGDVDFQRKCLGRMKEVSKSGRTVLFVSHNMAALQNLCPRSILIESGQVIRQGTTEDIIAEYLKSFESTSGSRDLDQEDITRSGTGEARIQRVQILSASGEPTSIIPMGEGMTVRLGILAKSPIDHAAVQVAIVGDHGEIYCRINSRDTKNWYCSLNGGQSATIDCVIPMMNLAPGRHQLTTHILGPYGVVDAVQHAVNFDVVPSDVFGTGRLPFGKNVFFLSADWAVKEHWRADC